VEVTLASKRVGRPSQTVAGILCTFPEEHHQHNLKLRVVYHRIPIWVRPICQDRPRLTVRDLRQMRLEDCLDRADHRLLLVHQHLAGGHRSLP
jgi:hypothetical protein